MRLLITGGAGFIGSNFIRHLLARHPAYSIINLDKLTYAGNKANLRDVEKNPGHTFVRGDICDEKVVEEVASRVDVIINFAAETHVDRSILEPDSFLRTDVMGTFVLLEAARRHRHERFIQISTDEVYGSLPEGAATEEAPLRPSSPYAASKAAADLLVRSYITTYSLPAIITRSSNNFGPSQHPEKVIPLFITNALQDIPLPLYGDGKNVRDWIFVLDHCEALDLVLHKGKIGEVYNIGGGNERPNIAITETILTELKKPKSLIRFVQDRPGHDRRYALDSTKIRALGFSPRRSFEEALQETIRWYRDNRPWWETIRAGEFQDYYKKAYGERLS